MNGPRSFLNGRVTLQQGNCLDVVKSLADNSIDACVTDPPYALVSIVKRFGKTSQSDNTQTSDRSRKVADGYARLSKGFMGKDWDNGSTAFAVDFWTEVLRVLKPGAHVVAFGGTRSYHRLACAIEDTGFEIRDMIGYLYGCGFPKSHNINKSAAKDTCRCGAEAVRKHGVRPLREDGLSAPERTGEECEKILFDSLSKQGASAAGQPQPQARGAWPNCERCGKPILPEGLGTALKPAQEPICLARKPLSEPTVAANVLRWGTGAINIDACRIGADGGTRSLPGGANAAEIVAFDGLGRWPANLCHDGSPEVIDAFPVVGDAHAPCNEGSVRTNQIYGDDNAPRAFHAGFSDSGSAARFFFSAKADSNDRIGSKHPTVKPVDLMQWLCRLVTPPSRLVCSQCGMVAYEKSAKTVSCDSAVRALRPSVQAARQQASEPLLQQTVRKRGDDVETEGVRGVRQAISTKNLSTAMLRKDLRLPVDGEAQEKSQAVLDIQEGIQANLPAGPSAGESAGRICIRASSDSREEDRAASGVERGCSPHQSYQDGQPRRKPSIDGQDGSRQTESPAPQHPDMPSLSGADCDEPTCSHCGGQLELYRPTVLDPFAGTGTTGEAAWREGFNAVLIERESEYCADIERRMKYALAGPDERSVAIVKAKGTVQDAGPLFGGMDDAGGGQAGCGRTVLGKFAHDEPSARSASSDKQS